MTPDLLTLPWKIQIALCAGYAGYIIGYLGLRKSHTGPDVFFKTIIFSIFASGVFALRLPLHWFWEASLSLAAPVAVGLAWNTKILRLYDKALNRIGVRYRDFPSAWLNVSHDQNNYFTQISVVLENETIVTCDNLQKFSDAPLGSAVFGTDGDLAFHATHITDANGQTKEQQSTIDEHYGYRMTYIPSNRIMRVSFRRKPIP